MFNRTRMLIGALLGLMAAPAAGPQVGVHTSKQAAYEAIGPAVFHGSGGKGKSPSRSATDTRARQVRATARFYAARLAAERAPLVEGRRKGQGNHLTRTALIQAGVVRAEVAHV